MKKTTALVLTLTPRLLLQRQGKYGTLNKEDGKEKSS